MVRILDVLEHQLPVARDPLAQVTKHDELAAREDPVEVAEHGFAEIVVERLGLGREAGEDDAMAAHHREALQPVLLQAEILRHAALPAITAAERHPDQIAAEIVGPLMIRADELLDRAATDRAKLGAAVGAAIDEDMDLARRVAHGDDFLGAEPAA